MKPAASSTAVSELDTVGSGRVCSGNREAKIAHVLESNSQGKRMVEGLKRGTTEDEISQSHEHM